MVNYIKSIGHRHNSYFIEYQDFKEQSTVYEYQ